MLKQEVISLHDEKEKIEKLAIKKALNQGYLSPYDDEDLAKTLVGKWFGREYRRFIKDFGQISSDCLEKSNVRMEEIDKDYCEGELALKLKRAGQMFNPVMSEELTDYLEQIVHGHNRTYSSGIAFGKDHPIPRYLLEDTIYEVKDGQLYPADAEFKNLILLKSGISCNPPPKNLVYKMEDAALHCKSMYEKDKKLGGLNPEGGFPTRETYERLMDELHPEQFLNKGVRTKIWNLWSVHNVGSRTRHIGDSDSILSATQQGWDVYIESDKKRKKIQPFPQSFDKDNWAFITECTNKGDDLGRSIMLKLVSSVGDKNAGVLCKDEKGRYPTINIVCRLTTGGNKSSLPKNLAEVESARKNFIEACKKWNSRLRTLQIPVLIDNVLFPHLLKDGSDGDKKVSLL